MMSEFRGIPPGPNVGTQLKALRRKQKAAAAHAAAAPAVDLVVDPAVAAVPSGLDPSAIGPASMESLEGLASPQGQLLKQLDLPALKAWFQSKGWVPFDYQQAVWQAMLEGRSGLLHATTGAGKTFAVWMGVLLHCARLPKPRAATTRVLWITPMRALAVDTTRALASACQELATDCEIGTLTGDTEPALRTRWQRKPPFGLVTTPESLSLMLSRPASQAGLGALDVIVVDEWHELIGNKRGVQLQLALARLVRLNPRLQVWGLSATLGNLQEAMDTLLYPIQHVLKSGSLSEPQSKAESDEPQCAHEPVLIQGLLPKRLVIDSLIPASFERFPWGGHLGLRQLEEVAREIDSSSTTLIFTNTRAQAEIWYQALLDCRPEYAGLLALHHGSLDKSVREWVENGLKQGSLKAVVCTSSLDLGVDFLPVERVIQIGSPKGVARLLQRAGRSGHAPGRPSRITVVPTHALELLEAAAARHSAEARQIEQRHSPVNPLDVLVQHLVTVAMGSGFEPDQLYAEVGNTQAYSTLTREAFDWALSFVVQGGASLQAYPDYQRVALAEDGLYRVLRRDIARRHAMSIGTIVSDSAMHVAWMTGGRLGTIEESFIARLKTGECFSFAGRVLELVKVRDMTAYVRKANRKKATVPQWQGGKMPLSTELSHAVLQKLEAAWQHLQAGSSSPEPELLALQDLLALQRRVSDLPRPGVLVAEHLQSKEGFHLFLYPFQGRLVHMGLASLLAWRASQHQPNTFSIAVNDYGFELLSAVPMAWDDLLQAQPCLLFSEEGLFEDITACLNASELAQRRFREIARISGLVFQGYPGAGKSTKQLQASSGLFFEVFKKYDQGNLLLTQAEHEALEQELEIERLKHALHTLRESRMSLCAIQRPSPFAFPLMIERLRETVSNESLHDRVARMVAELEKDAGL